ncbi:MAG: 2,3-diphosphoglycerate synthetase, partial [Actinomycetota bacterium]|nr:2,3-diphosphoglycerate synthetase [Actinomycetota bacterium]
IPPVETGTRVLVTSAAQPVEVAAGYLNAYRILVSDLVVLTGAEGGSAYEELTHAIAGVKDVPVVPVVLRPRPVEPILGRRVAYFSTAPAEAHETLARHLREEHGAEVALVSGNLARRSALREELERVEAEVFLVEIKASAIDVVAEAALERGAEVVFADNELVPVGVLDLDTELIRLADSAAAREAVPR